MIQSNNPANRNLGSLPSKTSFLVSSILENSKIAGIFIMDEHGIILEINPGVTKFFGYSLEDVRGKNFTLLFTKEDRENGFPERELKEVITNGSASDNNYVVHKNGDYIWVHGESILGKDVNDRDYVVKVVYDLSVQHSLEKKLIRINNDLNNFVYTASHDLKTPINNIDGLITMLEDTINSNENPKEVIKMMKDSVNKFKSLIKELADTGKRNELEGKGVSNLIQFKEIAEEVIDNLKEPIEEANASIQFDFTMATEIDFQKKNLRSLIHNLLSNAIKFNDPSRKPEIFMSTEKTEDYIILKVKDNGIGIKKSNINRLFNIYERFDKDVEGTGVGLAIVKRILDNSGGKIEVDSKEGVGSTFCVYFKISS